MQELTQTSLSSDQELKKFAQLMLQYRVIWYKQVMIERLLRFKHAIIIFLVCTVPTLSAIPQIFASPFLFLLSTDQNISIGLITLSSFLIHSIYVIWIVLQKDAITGGSPRKYLLSLPILSSLWKKTDFKLLLIANNLFWLPIFFSFIHIIKFTHTWASFMMMCSHWFLLALSLMSCQWLYLQKRLASLLFTMIVTTCVFVLLHLITHPYLSILIALLGIFNSVYMMNQAEIIESLLSQLRNPKKGKKTGYLQKETSHFSKLLLLKWSTLFKINLSILWRRYFQESCIRLAVCFFSLLLLYQVSIFSSININTTYALAALPLLITSGWYGKLALEQKKYSAYLRSLPISNFYWTLLNIGTVFFIVFLLQLLFFIPFLIERTFTFSRFFMLVLLEVPLVVAVYFSQTLLRKQGTIASVLTTASWLYIMMII